MLGITPLVSISDRRLKGMLKFSLAYLSARRALAVSISRMVRPNFSLASRSFWPAFIRTAPSGLLDSTCSPMPRTDAENLLFKSSDGYYAYHHLIVRRSQLGHRQDS